jgi:hypothetical protein
MFGVENRMWSDSLHSGQRRADPVRLDLQGSFKGPGTFQGLQYVAHRDRELATDEQPAQLPRYRITRNKASQLSQDRAAAAAITPSPIGKSGGKGLTVRKLKTMPTSQSLEGIRCRYFRNRLN